MTISPKWLLIVGSVLSLTAVVKAATTFLQLDDSANGAWRHYAAAAGLLIFSLLFLVTIAAFFMKGKVKQSS